MLSIPLNDIDNKVQQFANEYSLSDVNELNVAHSLSMKFALLNADGPIYFS